MMDYATKFCLIFCMTSVFCSVSEALNNTENSTSEPTDIDCNDFCRLRYHANDSVLILKPGEYKIRTDGTLYIDLNNSTLNKTLFEVWSNDSAANSCDCKYQFQSWQFSLAALLVCVIALQLCLTMIVMVNDPVRLIEVTATYIGCLLVVCFVFAIVQPFDCPQNHRTVHGFLHYVSLTWVFWNSSAVFDNFMNQVRYLRVRPGGLIVDVQFTYKNVIHNFMVRMLAVVSISTLLDVIEVPYIEPITEGAAESCGLYIPHTTMYLTFTRSVIAYLIIGFTNFTIYRRFLVGRELTNELLRILKDLCDLDFMFFAILAFTFLVGCLFSVGEFVFYASIVELTIFLVLLCNFVRYCYTIDWNGAFV